jgi:acyl-CoA synthetase (NDP forming)
MTSKNAQDVIAEARAAKRTALDEFDGKQLLAAYGIAVPRSLLVQDVNEAAEACRTLKPPLVLKVVSPDLLHKSDVGGVRTGLEGRAEVEEAIRAMMKLPEIASARIDGFLLEEMAPAGLEVVIGGLRDPQFGPLVMVGLGGILVEVLADVSFRICPIARIDAEEMLDELKGAALLRGARGRKPASREAIIDALLRIGGEDGLLLRHARDIAEADINPLIVSDEAAVAVDARFVLAPERREERGERSESQRQLAHASSDASLLSPRSSQEAFKPLFEPKAIAVIGASTKGDALPNVFIRRLREHGYPGEIFPIHPAAQEVEGLAAYRSLAEMPRPVDYAYIAIAAAQVPPLLRGGNGRVRYAHVISSGFGEVDEGRSLQDELVAAARAGGMRLVGPNCMGMFSPRGRVSFAGVAALESGHVGVVSQSGGLGTDIIRRGLNRGLKYSALVSAGNCADVGAAELLEFYLADPQTKVIGLYIETARDGRRLFELLRAARAAKPVVILKGGRTEQGRAAALSHTGALAGDDRVWVGLSRQTGCVMVETLDQFVNALLIFQALAPRPSRPTRSAVLFGNGGGASVLATDAFARAGLDVTPFGAATVERLAALQLPPGTSIGNPVDAPVGTLRQEGGRVAEKILEAIYSDGGMEALVMHLNLSVFVGRTKDDVLDNLVQAALRVQEHHPGKAHFVLVLRSDGDPELEERRRGAGHPGIR